MNRRNAADDAWPDNDPSDEWDDGYDAEYSEESDPEEDEPTVPCPYCRREIHEDSSRCPYCEQYVSREDAPRWPKPWWLVVGVVAGLYAVYCWVFGCGW